MTNTEFWQEVYLENIRRGFPHSQAAERAHSAVKQICIAEGSTTSKVEKPVGNSVGNPINWSKLVVIEITHACGHHSRVGSSYGNVNAISVADPIGLGALERGADFVNANSSRSCGFCDLITY